MAKKVKYEDSGMFEALDFKSIGSKEDPCFGKSYDLTTDECKMCGDSELCCAVFAQALGKTRKKLEDENHFKDLDVLIDKTAISKTIKSSIKKGLSKKEILETLRKKYEITKDESRMLYREYINKNK